MLPMYSLAMEIIKTIRGGKKAIFEGFMYTKQKEMRNKIRWRCVQRALGCKGSIITTNEASSKEDPILTARHNHAPDVEAIEIAKCRNAMKERAANSHDKPSIIFAEAVRHLPLGAKAVIATEATIKRSIRRNRRLHYPPDPQSLEELKIDGIWATTGGVRPEHFLFYDNGPSAGSRIIAFGTKECLQFLNPPDIWMAILQWPRRTSSKSM